eukprot:Lankesteria_metandrocarpae@DN4864_c0_g1_i2.p1
MKFAVLSALSASYAAAAAPVQFGCIKESLLEKISFSLGSCTMNGPYAANSCCVNHWGYAMGGHWESSPTKTHHNEMRCLKEKPKGEYEQYEACNQSCPGLGLFTNPHQDGICGGGCKDCEHFPLFEKECTFVCTMLSVTCVYDHVNVFCSAALFGLCTTATKQKRRSTLRRLLVR